MTVTSMVSMPVADVHKKFEFVAKVAKPFIFYLFILLFPQVTTLQKYTSNEQTKENIQ